MCRAKRPRSPERGLARELSRSIVAPPAAPTSVLEQVQRRARERVGVDPHRAVEVLDRRHAVGREELVEDRVLALAEALARLQRTEHEFGPTRGTRRRRGCRQRREKASTTNARYSKSS